LQPGQTLSVLIDNPIQRQFFRGYSIKLNSGPNASGCWQQDNCSTPAYDPGSITLAWGIGTFEYGTDGLWGDTSLFDTDTDSGVWIDFTLTTPTTYSFTMTPLDTNVTPYTATGTLAADLSIDWLELEFYNTDSDFYPVMVAGAQSTDFYVREMKITVADEPGLTGDFNSDGKVDAADYVMWRKDNAVGTYAEWQENFGEMQAGSGGGAVPEPAAGALVIASGAGLFVGGRRRR
jgi:hypothetical protein